MKKGSEYSFDSGDDHPRLRLDLLVAPEHARGSLNLPQTPLPSPSPPSPLRAIWGMLHSHPFLPKLS